MSCSQKIRLYSNNALHDSIGRSHDQKLKKKEYDIQYRKNLRREMFEILGNKCVECNVDDIRVLEFDHKKGGGKEDIRRLGGSKEMYKHYIRNPDLAKKILQILCSNCNQIKRYKLNECKDHGGISQNYSKKHKTKIRKVVIDILGNKCVNCGISDIRLIKVCKTNNSLIDYKLEGRNYNKLFHYCIDNPIGAKNNLVLFCCNCRIIHDYEQSRRLGCLSFVKT